MKINKAKHPESMNDFEKKHTPCIEIIATKAIVKVGCELVHPMNPEHHIEEIELYLNGELIGKEKLYEEGEPSATFALEREILPDDSLVARATCNLHGTWESV